MHLAEFNLDADETLHPSSSVTVVVPIFGDWESLHRCIESILKYVDLTKHKVVFVNDAGPEADQIEARLLNAVAGAKNIEYFRNEENLGFIRTCNRAVTEHDRSDNDVLLLNSDAELTAGAIDELLAVLYAAEHHGVVCPRSNNASIASIPFFHRSGQHNTRESVEDDRRAFDIVSSSLPRWYISPVAVGFCFMVRRRLIENHGLFDPEFGLGYQQENDFCMRVNAIGYSALIANRVFVPHAGMKSFTRDQKVSLDSQNQEILIKRYPHYGRAVESFKSFGYAAPDVFAEIAAYTDECSILLDLHHLELVSNGSTRYAQSLVKAFSEASLPPHISVTIAAQSDAIEFFRLDQYGLRVVPYRDVDGVYDVGVALAPLNSIDQLIHLNDHCARWVVCHFDMISSRAWELVMSDPLRPMMVEQGFRHADRILAISDFALRDAASFYPELREEIQQRAEAVHLGSTREMADGVVGDQEESRLSKRLAAAIESNSLIVIMGNFYPHKQVALAAAALDQLKTPVVAFGPVKGLAQTKNRTIVSSGTLPESDLRRLIESAALVIFPSAYEGYGLPIADALDAGVPVIAFDTSVAREVVVALDASSAVRFFNRFDELLPLVSDALHDLDLHEAAVTHWLRNRASGICAGLIGARHAGAGGVSHRQGLWRCDQLHPRGRFFCDTRHDRQRGAGQ